MDIAASAKTLSDAELLSRLAELALRERGATVEMIVHLVELDTRKLYRAEGYGSLFRYCTGALMLSEHAAYARIEAARIARTFPVVLDRLADGSLNTTTLCLVGPLLRPENHLDLLAQAAGRSKRDVEALVARLAPRPDLPTSVRKLRVSRPADPLPEVAALLPAAPASSAGDESGRVDATLDDSMRPPPTLGESPRPSPASVAPPVATSSLHRPAIAALAPERYRIQFTMRAETHEKLRLVQDLLRREIPDGDPAVIFDRALTLLLEDTARKKLGAAARPRPGRSSSGSRHVPAALKRRVWARDGGRCAFVAKTGRRCTERAYLEFHHVQPYALGGETDARNISLRCRSHNVYEAELAFGTEVMAARGPAAREGRTRPGPSGELEITFAVTTPAARAAPSNARC